MPLGLWSYAQTRQYNGREKWFWFPGLFGDRIDYVSSKTRFTPESEEGILAKIFAPFLPDYEKKWEEHWTRDPDAKRFNKDGTPRNFFHSYHQAEPLYSTPMAWECEVFWDQSMSKSKLRDHMASFP